MGPPQNIRFLADLLPRCRDVLNRASSHAPDYDSFLTTVFLVGLTLATVPHCRVAFSGCCLTVIVVIATTTFLVDHWIRCRTVKQMKPVRVVEREALQRESLVSGCRASRKHPPLPCCCLLVSATGCS